MSDYGARYADKAIKTVERQVHRRYKQASDELKAKLADFVRKHKAKDEIMRKKLEDGLITEQAYKSWQTGQVFIKKQWQDKINQCAEIMLHANQEAAKIVQIGRLDVFAENYNHAAYELERSIGNVGFTTYDAEAVSRLIRRNPSTLPKWKIHEKKDYLWNAKKVKNSVMEGIIQGEGVDKIADRLVETLCTQNENKMRTFARTAVTGAQNAGRQEQMKEAEELGVKLKKRWVATLDSRTRDAHAELDGQEVPVDEPFTVDWDGEHYEIDYPGDPSADGCMVYNCRCTMIQVYEGIDRKSIRRDEDDNAVENMTYKEWKEAKENGTLKTDKKLVEKPAFKQEEPAFNAPLIEKNEGRFVIVSDEDAGVYRVNATGELGNAVNDIEFGNLFNEQQAIETAETLEELQRDYPLDKQLTFVGDIRIDRGMPLDVDILDMQDEYPQFSGFSAKYVHTQNGDKIWIADEGLNTEKLSNEFKVRHALREKYMDANGMLTEKTAFEVVSDTVEGTLKHEWCHGIQYMVVQSDNNGECFNELYEYLKQNKEKVLQISKYATVHPYEMVSEAFVQKEDVHDTVATQTAKEIWSIFEKHLKKARQGK